MVLPDVSLFAAPEVFACALDKCSGYTYPADWWSLGVCVYEMVRGKRPYEIRPSATVADIRRTIVSHVVLYPPTISDVLRHLLKKLLTVDSSRRLSTLAELRKHCFVKELDLDKVLRREMKPTFVPSKDHLNCDPMYELEEMIIEEKPLHKKKKRLAKQNSKKDDAASDGGVQQSVDPFEVPLRRITHEYKTYNREKYLLKPRKVVLKDETLNKESVTTALTNETVTNVKTVS
ncbi:hypothetical protein NP493_1120g01053 [Ridgeia piscesae]|uniref:Protein kinase domain-containing protein n=1 Tax=Ridgeia piscesae TaxID=27915 RepID=A0AAD9KG02_RIDPI|nr:hypothetical protein NP493_1120g01053 [Ridgeia piscesae]